MLAFPQLSTGAITQLPMQRQAGYRTLVNRMLDGSEIRLADVDFYECTWEMPVELLTDAEWQSIENLFAATEGRLRSFVFLEPGENLLAWSEKFTEAAWAASGVSVTEGIDDPFGGTAASQVSGAGLLSQTLAIPSGFRYAASIWARTTQPGTSLQVSDGAGQQSTVGFVADGVWRRYSLTSAWASPEETVIFTVSAPVDIYGAQLEAQPLVSDYKKTLARGGVHAGARFGSDTLVDRATGVGEHSSVIRISWTPSQT